MTEHRRHCVLIGAPLEKGLEQAGCIMGPAAYRTAGIGTALEALGHRVEDRGDVVAGPAEKLQHPNTAIRHLGDIVAWSKAIHASVYGSAEPGTTPVIMGGDHSIAIGALSALSKRAKEAYRPFFLLWLDAHPDLHTPDTTQSGNLHGTPVSYLLGDPSFNGLFPENDAPIQAENICMMGIRSVDQAEQDRLNAHPVTVHDMRAIDEFGVVSLLRPFLETVRKANGMLHVTLDVDFLDPEIAPGVNTTVPGGATFREAHLIMEMLHDAGCVTSLDLVELNPYLDDRGKTARLMVELTASLFGQRVLQRRSSGR